MDDATVTRPNTLVIDVDDSARSEDAIAFGRLLAGRSRCRLIVAAVFRYDDAGSSADHRPYREALESEDRETAQRMSELLEGVPPELFEIAVAADTSPSHAVHDVAEREGAALIVVDATGTGPLTRVVAGATAERLLDGSPYPVAVVPHGYRAAVPRAIRRIGVPYQHAEEGDLALAAGVAAAVELTGDALEAIVARTSQLDLLVMGSRGFGPLRSILERGVSGRVLRDAECLVVVIPRGVQRPLDAPLAIAPNAVA